MSELRNPEGPLARIVTKEGRDYLRTFNSRYGEGPIFIPLSVVFSLVDKGNVEDRFSRDTLPRLSDILLCRAYAATHLPERPEYRENINPKVRLRILLDENLSNKLLYPLTKAFNNLTHVYHEYCGGEEDAELFCKDDLLFPDNRRTKNRNKSPIKRVIFSKDSDMTDLAVESWIEKIEFFQSENGRMPELSELNFDDVPAVFQCCDKVLSGPEACDIYIRYAEDIKRLTYNQEAASYEISRSGVRPVKGATFDELVEKVKQNQALANLHSGIDPESAIALLESIKPRTMKVVRREMWAYSPDGTCVAVAA